MNNKLIMLQVIVIVLPLTIARSLLTIFRTTPLRHILPLNEHLDVHRQLGYHFFVWGLVHSVCHFINAARNADPSRRHVQADPHAEPQPQYYRKELQVSTALAPLNEMHLASPTSTDRLITRIRQCMELMV